MRKKFQTKQTVNVFVKINAVPKATNLYYNNSTFGSRIYTSSLAGNKSVHTPIQGTIREKYFIHIILTGKMSTLAGN